MDASNVISGDSDTVDCLKNISVNSTAVPFEVSATPPSSPGESFAIVTDGSFQVASAAPSLPRVISSADSSFAVVQTEHGPCSLSFVEITNEKYAEMSGTEGDSSFVVVKDNNVHRLGDNTDNTKTKDSQSSGVLQLQNTVSEEFALVDDDASIDPSFTPLAKEGREDGSLTTTDNNPSCEAMPLIHLPKAADSSPTIQKYTADAASKSEEGDPEAHTSEMSSTEIESSFVIVKEMEKDNNSSMLHQQGDGTEDVKTFQSSDDFYPLNTVDEEFVPVEHSTSCNSSVKPSAREAGGSPTAVDYAPSPDGMSSIDLPKAVDGSPMTHVHAARYGTSKSEEGGSAYTTHASSKSCTSLMPANGAAITGPDPLSTTEHVPLEPASHSPNQADHVTDGKVSREIENVQRNTDTYLHVAKSHVQSGLTTDAECDLPCNVDDILSKTDSKVYMTDSATLATDEPSKLHAVFVSKTDSDTPKTENVKSKEEGNSSDTACVTTTADCKLKTDLHNSVTGGECAISETEKAMSNTAPDTTFNTITTIASAVDHSGSSPASAADLSGSSPASAADLSGSSPASAADLSGSSPASAADLSGSSPASAADLSGSSPASAADLSGSSPASAADISRSSPASAADLSGSSPASAADLSGSSPTSAADLSGSSPASMNEVSVSKTDNVPCQTGDDAAKMDSIQAKTDNELSKADNAFPEKNYVQSEKEGLSASTDDKLLPNFDHVPSTCMTVNDGAMSKMVGDIPKAKMDANSKTEAISSNIASADNPKPNTDLQKSITGDDCTYMTKPETATANTDGGIPKATEGSNNPGTAASDTICQTTQQAAAVIASTEVPLQSSPAAPESDGSSTASKNTAEPDNRLYHCRGKNTTCNNNPSAGASRFDMASPPSAPADGSCVQVTFHVFVPQDLWGWDEYSCVHLCFGHKKMGSWKICHGEFSQRDPSSTDPMCEMTCTLSMDTEVLKDPLPYKYVIYSPKVMKRKVGHPFEYLYFHSKNHGHNNRCLVVTDPERRIGSNFVQYDTIAYPCEEVVGVANSKASKGGGKGTAGRRAKLFSIATQLMKATIGKVLSYATGANEGSFALPQKEERLYSLCVYLNPYADALCNGTYTNDLVKMAEEIEHICSLMSKVQISNDKGIKKESVNISQEIVEFFCTTLENVNSQPAGTQLCTSVIIIYCLYGLLRMELPAQSVSLGLNMLRPNPFHENKSCLEITILHSLIPEEKRCAVGYAIWQLCSQQWLNNKEPLHTEWLHALPLAHLLCGCCTPFGEMPKPKDLQWVDRTIQHDLFGRNEILNAFEQYEVLQDLFLLDPLLLPVFVHVYPKKELTNLFKYIPSYVSTAYISYMISIEEWTTSRVNEYSSLLSVITKAKDLQDKTSNLNMAIKESCSMLIDEINKKIQTTQKGHSVELIKSFIPLVLLALSKHNDQSGKNDLIDTALYSQLASLMEAWITSKDLIGHPSFGGKEDALMSSWKGKDELKLWQEVLKIEIDCSVTVLAKWYSVVGKRIKQRIYQLKEKAKLNLVCYVEELPDIHTLLVNAVFEIGAEAIDAIFVQGGKQALDHIEELAQKESIRIGKLIGRILEKKYPFSSNRIYEVTFVELIDWECWPCFIRISCGTSKVKDGLNEHCIAVCRAAVMILNHICTQLSSGEILVKELLRVKEREQHLLMLCEAAKMVSISVQETLKQRMHELICYKSHRELLNHFLSHSGLPRDMQGLNELHCELKKDISNLSIRALCTSSSSGIVKVIIPAAGPLNNIAQMFHIMTSKYPCSTFDEFWKSHLNNAIGKYMSACLSFNHVCDNVWKPSLSLCSKHVASCWDQTIQLETIDILFKSVQCQGVLENELFNLSQGVSLCERDCEYGGEWVQSTCTLIRNYWELCTCKEAAAVVIQLKDKIQLKGDFKNVEMLQKGIENDMKCESLNKITDVLVSTGKFLKDMASDIQKRQCIEMFQKCVGLRKWLKKVTKGVNDLNRFVTIALSTATGGEDALTQEKLYNLRAVGSGYGPLIYSLSSDAGFHELSKHCSAVWKVLQTNHELPTLLDGCMEHLDWYKHIKQNIGSVEQSSFKQLEHIQSHGQYSVSSAAKRSFSRVQIQDVVQLNILPEDAYAIKRQYTLDELRDLESRLILVTSQEAKNRKDVDQFIHTLHSICCIGEVLVELQRAGNVSYNGWNLTCSCKTGCVEDLKELAKQMEMDLQSWKKELMSMRDTYYELNYYTNAQLLVIRKEMANEKYSSSLLLLLQSISTKITEHHLKMAVRSCLENVARQCDDITEILGINQDVTSSVQELPRAIKSELNISMTPTDSHYLTLQQVGQILRALKLTLQDGVENQRRFSGTLACGKPNLISTDSSNVLRAVLSIYMEDPSSPLPTLEEVLLCDHHTTEEEALLLFKRAIKDPGFKRIYCLVHAEKLSYKVADNVLRLLDEITQGHIDYRLVILCGTDEEGVSHVTAKLQLFQRPFKLCDENACAQYLQSKLLHVPVAPLPRLLHRRTSFVNKNRYSALVVSSTRSGMGKSLHVQRMAQDIRGSHVVHVPVHGPEVKAYSIMELLEHNVNSKCTIFHLDVVPTVLHQSNSILFSLLVLRGLTDVLGNTWRCDEKDVYVVEVTVPEQEDNVVATSALSFLNLLPRVKCASPLQLREANGNLPGVVGCDTLTFQHESYQLVYRYLSDSRGQRAAVEINLQAQLRVYMQHCGLRDPSWSELDHFIKFLAAQLDACKNSIYCDETFVGDTLRGMKDFVVKLMIRMSRDFATPSLQGELTHEGLTQHQGEADEHSVARYQINEQKKWEKSFHPYLFFNKDRVTITFVGFIVTPQGDLVDPRRTGPLQQSPSQQCPSVLHSSVFMPGIPSGEYHGSVINLGHQEPQYGASQQPRRSINFTSVMQGMPASSFPSGYPSARETMRRGITVQRESQSASTVPSQNIIERSIMSPQLFSGLDLNGVNFKEDYSCWKKMDMITKLAIVMGLGMEVKDPDPSYALTVDNVLKILAMQMRFRCDIPVILMGESGCGKTRLVQYMCNLAAQSTETTNMKILKVHGGTTEDDIVLCVREAEELAKHNTERGLDTVVFFDEANTTEAIGLIKEIMCDGRMKGSPISTNVKFIAACNPYRRHSDDMIEKLESAGLGFFVKCTETQDRLGKTPLRHLVYRVLELPPSMRSLVYDFGQLDTKTEADYIIQIVKNGLGVQFSSSAITAIAHVLSWSQQYMKDQKDECSYVSLRDVKRAVNVFRYFFGNSTFFNQLCLEQDESDHKKLTLTSSVILSLAMCYSARLLNRDDYEENVCMQFRQPIALPGGVQQFREEVKRCQEILLASMEVEPNIAHNTALRENVFMMAICIELRIPLFIIGKPGSSKSLAKSIVTSSMLGAASSKSLLKQFKEVYVESYQCSQHSTPESIKGVFKTAQKLQDKHDCNNFVSVVILDEVGLAEDSPHLPLKALHPLLEDGTQDDPSTSTRVAFIGISNWALDPAKMNRGLMLTRGEPSIQELIDSAHGICSGLSECGVLRYLNHIFEPLARAYQAISKRHIESNATKKEFYGLRDFYSLIKMLYCICKSHGRMPSLPEIRHAILRNFGGIEGSDPCEEFLRQIDMRFIPKHSVDTTPDTTLLGMIKSSLVSKDSTFNGESRYLLFLTENYAALQILLQHLKDVMLSHSGSGDSVEPYVLFGSSFPKDKEYTQICQNVNQIKLCMETGRTVILLNLENLYESLYDALNQYYIKCFGKRYVDLGLQAHKVKCMVHEDFKLVLIAEKRTVYEKFPIPLISRLEKHYVVTSSVFKDWQNDVLARLIEWAKKFSALTDFDSSSDFKVEEAFIGYQKDTPAAAIFQATKQCHQIRNAKPVPCVTGSISVDELSRHGEGSEYWKKAVLLQSQHLLLQTATPDAVVRLDASNYKTVQSEYFKHMYCSSLPHYLTEYLSHGDESKGHLMQVTTHSRVLSRSEILEMTATLPVQTEVIFLHQFDAEIDFSNKIRTLFQRKLGKENENVLVIIQCQSGHQYGDLIACARYRVNDERVKIIQSTPSRGLQHAQSHDSRIIPQSNAMTHVLFIIYLPRQTPSLSFVGFQGDPWSSVHIDELRPSDEEITSIDAIQLPISELFYRPINFQSESQARQHAHGHGLHYAYHKRLHGCIQAAVARLQSSTRLHDRGTMLVTTLLGLIPEAPPQNLDQVPFYEALVRHVHSLLKQLEEILPQCKKWALNEARSHKSLRHGGTLRNTLIKKIDDMITPFLAYILSFICQYHNLALYKNHDVNPVSQLWLAIFSDSSVVQFKYSEISKTMQENKAVPFGCHFPFFWIAKEAIEANITVLGSDFQTVLKAVISLPIGKILKLVPAAHRNDLFKRYLADFIASTHTSLHEDAQMQNIELKLVSYALDGSVQATFNGSVASDISMVHMMTALHLALHANKSCLLWISNLMFCVPAVVLKSLKSKSSLQQLASHVVEETVIYLRPPLETDEAVVNKWLLLVQRCQITVETLLALHPADYSRKLCHDWHCIRAMQMFVEHISSRFEGMQLFALQMFMEISDCTQIAEAITIQKIKAVLQSMDCSKNRELERSCHTFFIELISQLCFGHERPSQALIKLLFDTVFYSRPREGLCLTRQLSYKEEIDKIPVIRSSLLQLLLKHSFESVQEYVQEYFVISKQILQQQAVDSCLLCLLCIKCFQDVINSKHEHKPLREQVGIAYELLEKCHEHLICGTGRVTFDFLLAAAQCRIGLLIAGECLHESSHVQINASLLTAVKKICTNKQINRISTTEASGPNIFLLKVLARSHNMTALKQIAKKHTWILPPALQSSEEDTQPDTFVSYGPDYCMVRDCVADAMFGRNLKGLEIAFNDLEGHDRIFIILALYEVVTLNRILSKQRQFTCTPDPEMVLAIERCKVLPGKLKIMSKNLLLCNQDSLFVRMWASSPQSEILSAIVVHTAVAMISGQRLPMLWPFITMLNDPASLMNTYLPTMPEDILPHVRQVLNSQAEPQGQFYECPNGHHYFVGDCGRPMQQATCPECHAPIGGQNHQSVVNNRTAQQSNGSSQCGYILPPPAKRSSEPVPERQLSPIACCLVRIMMHSVLLWACNMEISDDVVQLLRGRDAPTTVQFLLQHLGKDFETLQKAVRKSELECAILVHTVLKSILSNHYSGNLAINQLRSSFERSEWEKTFCDTYITPVLKNMGETVPKALEMIMNDDKKEYGRLMYIINEKLEIAPADLDTHAWAYHPNLSLESLSIALESQSLQGKYPILYKFLQNEHALRASQCIQDIYKLLSFLHSRYNHRVDHKEAASTTVASFLCQLPAHISGDVKMMLDCLNRAWELCKTLLKANSRLEIKDENLIPSFTPDVPLECIIPTTVGAGVCVTALLDFLVRAHNDFVIDCKTKLQEENSKVKCQLQKVHIQHVQRFHTLDYEAQLCSVISSHCEYSLVTGKSQNVQYDFFGIQKQLINQFINGKPIIIPDIPHVVYRKDVHSIQNFSKIKEQLRPQVKLPAQSQQEILGELTSIPQLKEALNTVETLMAFLTGGSSMSVEMNLSKYAESLKIKLCSKIQELCKLSHVLSLWETVSVSMARQHVIRKEEPFEGIQFQKNLTVHQTQRLKSVLRHFKLDQLVSRLYIFISIYIRNAEKHEQETTSIIQGMDIFRDTYDDDDDIPGFATHFPSDITLHHAVSAWKLIVEHQNTIEGFKLM